MKYNATAYTREADGTLISVEAVQVDEGRVVRACGYWSPNNGTERFQDEWLRTKKILGPRVEVVLDGTAGYRAAIQRLITPPSYYPAAEEEGGISGEVPTRLLL